MNLDFIIDRKEPNILEMRFVTEENIPSSLFIKDIRVIINDELWMGEGRINPNDTMQTVTTDRNDPLYIRIPPAGCDYVSLIVRTRNTPIECFQCTVKRSKTNYRKHEIRRVFIA